MTDNPINKSETVKFLKHIQVRNGVPVGTAIMAPEYVFKKVAAGEPLTADDLRLCCATKWSE